MLELASGWAVCGLCVSGWVGCFSWVRKTPDRSIACFIQPLMNQETLNTACCLKWYSDWGIFFSSANTLDAAFFQDFKKIKNTLHGQFSQTGVLKPTTAAEKSCISTLFTAPSPLHVLCRRKKAFLSLNHQKSTSTITNGKSKMFFFPRHFRN